MSAGRTLPDDRALVDHGDAVGDFPRASHVVGDGERGRAELVSTRHDEVVDDIGHDGVEPGRRLVEEDDLGPGRDRAGEAHPLAHAAGERGRVEIGRVLTQTHLGEGLNGNASRLAARRAVRLDQTEGDVLPHLQAVEEGCVLEQHADPAHGGLARRAVVGQLLAVDGHAAGIGAQQAEQALEHHRLADAGAADDHHRFPGAHLEVEAVQHHLAGERLAEAAQGDLGLVRAPAGAVVRGRAHWAKNASVMM